MHFYGVVCPENKKKKKKVSTAAAVPCCILHIYIYLVYEARRNTQDTHAFSLADLWHPDGDWTLSCCSAGQMEGEARRKEALDRVDGMLGVLAQDKARKKKKGSDTE